MPITPDIAAAEAAIVEMTNAFRAEQKLLPVRHNPKLAAAARAYARKLAAYEHLSHTADGTTPSARVAAAGYRYCQVGENLASIFDTRGFDADDYAERAVEGWEESPGHRKNMMLPYVTEIGVAVARASATSRSTSRCSCSGGRRRRSTHFKITNLSGPRGRLRLRGAGEYRRSARDHHAFGVPARHHRVRHRGEGGRRVAL